MYIFYIKATSTTEAITDCRTLKILVYQWQTTLIAEDNSLVLKLTSAKS